MMDRYRSQIVFDRSSRKRLGAMVFVLLKERGETNHVLPAFRRFFFHTT